MRTTLSTADCIFMGAYAKNNSSIMCAGILIADNLDREQQLDLASNLARLASYIIDAGKADAWSFGENG